MGAEPATDTEAVATYNSVEEIENVLSTPSEFISWLESLPPDAPLGRAKTFMLSDHSIEDSMTVCPIRNWLARRYGPAWAWMIFVGTRSTSVWDRPGGPAKKLAELPNPDWMVEFVSWVDLGQPRSWVSLTPAELLAWFRSRARTTPFSEVPNT